jgi:hypothetical protein
MPRRFDRGEADDALIPGVLGKVDYPAIHSIDGASGIKGVDWLTVLADTWLEKLGGVEAVRAQLDDRGPHRFTHESSKAWIARFDKETDG